MDNWFILQIILDIYICGFVVFYIISYRKKEFDLLKRQKLREVTETRRINETLKDFLKDSEAATLEMIDAFKKEHHSIKQSINQLNLKMEQLDRATKSTKDLLDSVKEQIPDEEVRYQQEKLRYREAASLLSKGFAPTIVAEKLKMPVGEVELVSKFKFDSQKEPRKHMSV